MNKDISGLIVSPSSGYKSPGARSTHRSQKSSKRSTSKKAESRLPKLNLSGLVAEFSSAQDRAIDSNRAIAFAYYTRKLMHTGWRSFFNFRLEQANKRFHLMICSKKWAKKLKRKAIRSLMDNLKAHLGHSFDRKRAIQ